MQKNSEYENGQLADSEKVTLVIADIPAEKREGARDLINAFFDGFTAGRRFDASAASR
jgi:hypothetical protein